LQQQQQSIFSDFPALLNQDFPALLHQHLPALLNQYAPAIQNNQQINFQVFKIVD